MLHGTTDELSSEPTHRPKHRKPDELAILPVGDVAGRTYEDLYVEHAPAARAVALSMVPRDVAGDIVAEAFTRVLGAIRAGGGPGLAFRAYLLAAVRNTANDWLRASRRTTAVGDLEQDLDDRVPEENLGLARLSRGPEAEAEARVEATLVARAFGKLPARWQAVLWQLEVEARAPAAVAPAFGLSANGVSALAVRPARAFARPTWPSTWARTSQTPAGPTPRRSAPTPAAGSAAAARRPSTTIWPSATAATRWPVSWLS